MNILSKPMTLIGLSAVVSSAAHAHNSDGTFSSVFHFITAPDHLGLAALVAVMFSAAYLRLQKGKMIRVPKK